ncbi:MAG: type III polyketide synthase [Hyphomicrobiaceae bacterium]|nr:type III polyketide synthase [Hyphomicrobiaceae bacterium]
MALLRGECVLRHKKSRLDVTLLSIATAVPPHVMGQREAIKAVETVFADQFGDFDRIAAIFASAGIAERHITRPLDWYFGGHGWPERTAAYLDGALALFVEAAGKALDRAGIAADAVDSVVTVSSTGIATPSLEARALASLGFRRDVQRVPVFGLGCAGGVAGLALGADLAMARPGSVVLVVAVELCSLAVRRDQATKANMVALALFGDGAAAAVLTSGRVGEGGRAARIMDSGHYTWPGTLDIMGWKVDPVGFGVIFDQSIPAFAREHLGASLDAILSAQGLARSDIDRFVCHPGGRKVVEAFEGALGLRPGSLDYEREVLRRYGNMSAPTVLFVLERALESGLPERAMLIALGPGFTVSTATLAGVSAGSQARRLE